MRLDFERAQAGALAACAYRRRTPPCARAASASARAVARAPSVERRPGVLQRQLVEPALLRIERGVDALDLLLVQHVGAAALESRPGVRRSPALSLEQAQHSSWVATAPPAGCRLWFPARSHEISISMSFSL